MPHRASSALPSRIPGKHGNLNISANPPEPWKPPPSAWSR
jgi:hypothetical protein